MERHHHEDGEAAQITQCQTGLGHTAGDRPVTKSTAIITPRLEGSATFPAQRYYALIRRPHNEQAPCRRRDIPSIAKKIKADCGVHINSRSLGLRARSDGYPTQRVSLRAEILRLGLRLLKERQGHPSASVATVRRRLKRIERLVPRPPAGTRTTVIDGSGVNTVHVAVRQARSDRCVLYFHGGAYALGTAALLQDFLWRIGAAARACVLYFDYRLAPEHPFPAALEDAVAVYRWLAGRFDARRIAFVGDSAGGGLALATLYKLRDEGLAMPAAVVAVSPWTDLALTGPSLKLNAAADPWLNVAALPVLASGYLGGADPYNHYASPLYGDASGLPPTLIHVGSDEILRDDAIRMADKLRAAGCDVEIEVWPRMPHAWHLFARILPEGRDAIERIGAFLQQRI
jgi:acetyl esterase/lipase